MAAFAAALASGNAASMEITIYNPHFDEYGSARRDVADLVTAALGASNALRIHESRGGRHDKVLE